MMKPAYFKHWFKGPDVMSFAQLVGHAWESFRRHINESLITLLLAIGASCFPAYAQIAAPQVEPGQSLTQLADGNWLIAGGPTSKPSAVIRIFDRAIEKSRDLPISLNIARTGHTSTLLPDGRILIFGGVDAAGAPVQTPELLHVPGPTVSILPDPGLLPRSQHTSTLLADGRILITGGVGTARQALFDAEILDIEAWKIDRFNVRMQTARFAHWANLLPSNTVLLSGGIGLNGQAVVNGEMFDPQSLRFSPIGTAEAGSLLDGLAGMQPAVLVGSTPANGNSEHPVGAPLVIRFSKWMDPASLNGATVRLVTDGKQIAARVIAAERGLLLFVTPLQPLAPTSSFSLEINGAQDAANQPIFKTSINFSTGASLRSSADQARRGGGVAKSQRGLPPLPASDAAPAIHVPKLADAQRLLAALPLQFEENTGRHHSDISFTARGNGYQLFLGAKGAVMVVRQPDLETVAPRTQESELNDRDPEKRRKAKDRRRGEHALLRVINEGGNQSASAVGEEMLPGKTNYIRSRDLGGSKLNIANYAKARFENVFPGIDQVYYGTYGILEYDWIVAPGADPRQIVQRFQGAKPLDLDEDGNLNVRVGRRHIVFKKPVAYQQAGEAKVSIDVGFRLLGDDRIGFNVGAYDTARPLVIDPVVTYSTYFGGNGYDFPIGIAVNSAGEVYIAGEVVSSTFPGTAGAFQPTTPNNNSIYYLKDHPFVTKFNAAGSALVYSTHVEGDYAGCDPKGMALGPDGAVYVVGTGSYYTSSPLPAASYLRGAQTNGQESSFVFKLSPTGSAINYFTNVGYVALYSVAVDANGYLYIAGTAWNSYAGTAGSAQPARSSASQDGFIAKLNTTGNGLLYATYYGGGNGSTASIKSIAFDGAGNLHFAGQVYGGSISLPLVNAFQSTPNGSPAGFFGKLNAAGSAFVYASYYQKSDLRGVAVDWQGNAYLVGSATTGAPRVNDGGFALYSAIPSGQGASVAKVSPTGSVMFASTMANTGEGNGVAVDIAGNMYVIGSVPPGANPVFNDLGKAGTTTALDAFIAKVPANASISPMFATIGGSGEDVGTAAYVDRAGKLYLAGYTSSTNFPTVTPYQSTNQGSTFSSIWTPPPKNAFIVKISDPPPLAVLLSSSANPSTPGQAVTFSAAVTGNNPGGSITFTDGATSLGTVVLVNGVASVSTSSLANGVHSITASYGGDANNAAAASSVLSQIVGAAGATPTATALTSSVSGSIALNAPILLTATVTGTNPSGGSVTFLDNGVPLSAVPLVNAMATLSTTGVVTGSHNVIASYSGSATNLPSLSTARQYTVVAPPTISISAPADGTSYTLPTAVPLTVTASSSGSTITLVRFLSNNAEIGRVTNAPYQFNWSTAPPGYPSIVAEATDALGQIVTSAPITVRVHPNGGGSTVTYFHQDLSGNTVAASDDIGQVVFVENYRPYGDRINTQPTPNPTQLAQTTGNRLWFHGKAQDESTRLSYFGARYYDPAIGRFMGVDAEGFVTTNLHSFNRYAYGNNNPYRYMDPDGRYGQLILALVVVAGISGPVIVGGGYQAGPPASPPLVTPAMPPSNNRLGGFGEEKIHFYPTLPGFISIVPDLLDILITKGGESEAAARGRQAHKNYENTLGGGYEFNKALPSGKRPDAIDWENKDVRELKPNNKKATKRGQKQVQGYKDELEAITGEKWTSNVDTYEK